MLHSMIPSSAQSAVLCGSSMDTEQHSNKMLIKFVLFSISHALCFLTGTSLNYVDQLL